VGERGKGLQPADLGLLRMHRPDRPGEAHLAALSDDVPGPDRPHDGDGARAQKAGEVAAHAPPLSAPRTPGAVCPRTPEDISKRVKRGGRPPEAADRDRGASPVAVIGFPACTAGPVSGIKVNTS